jgi:glycerophosphoryl diester phosphodiesterase
MTLNTKCGIISHRGVCRTSPNSARSGENTIEAFKEGIAQLKKLDCPGAVEFDVRLSQDKIPVIIHDELVDRTTHGRGLLRNYTVADIKKFDAGFGRKIPLLSEVLDVFKEDDVFFHIELKENGLAEIVEEMVFARNLQARTMVSAFDHDDIDEESKHSEYYSSWADLCKIQARLSIAFLATDEKIKKMGGMKRYVEAAVNAKARAINPQAISVSEELVNFAHRIGLGVNSWTVNDKKIYNFFQTIGVDNVFCDNPAFLI